MDDEGSGASDLVEAVFDAVLADATRCDRAFAWLALAMSALALAGCLLRAA